MDFLTFVDKFFEKDRTKRLDKNKIVLLYENEIIVKFPGYYYRLELEKEGINSFRLDIPYKDSDGGHYLTFHGTYNFVKSILVDLFTMDYMSFKLSYGKNKPDMSCINFDFEEIYKSL